MVLRRVRLSFVVQCLALAAALVMASAARAEPPSAANTALRDRLLAAAGPAQRLAEQDALQKFYESRSYAPIWFDEAGPTRAALRVLHELKQAGDWGLDAADFALEDVTQGTLSRTWDQTAAAELDLAAAILKYARHAGGGRIEDPERVLSDFIDRKPQVADPLRTLNAVAAATEPDDALRRLHPQHEQFQKLREVYARERKAASDTAASIAAEGPILAKGVKHADVVALRQRFGLTPPAQAPDVFDAKLVDAVKQFQRANALRADGMVGPKTRKALLAKGGRLEAMRATLEQWRWMPADLGQKHLFVNIASQTIDFVQDGKTRLTENVIVGKPNTPTPVFSKAMRTLVLRPSWILPDSIKKERLLSVSRRGSSLESLGLVVKKGKKTVKSWSVDWSTANLSHYAIYQPSGDGNALGKVKFLFPNKYSVYLHDTPDKKLFGAEARAFSHGCIRLRNPLEMAQAILDADKGEGTMAVGGLIEDGADNNEIVLTTPLPVHVGYFSVWAGADGDVQLLDDVYGHTQRVALALSGRRSEIDRGPAHDVGPQVGVYADLQSGEAAATVRPSVSPPRRAKPAASAASRAASASRPARAVARSRGGYVSELMNSAFAR